ncbi:MAG TPA: DUF3226 domain-containing protein [Pirellulales bacterium]|nr:DUF3226 domain-containing protein [Pirellulales bacterium]
MGSRFLLVEGLDDKHVMWALLKAHGVPETFRVEELGGVDELLTSVPLRLRIASDLERLAVILDADEDAQTRWHALRDRIRSIGFDVPDHPKAEGTVVELSSGVRFGAWIMPNNEIPGMLESFLAFLVPENDDLLPTVDSFLSGIVRPRFEESHLPKARIHSWLAVQKEPGKPLGQSITARYLDAGAPVIVPFLAWLRAALVD